MASVEPKKDVSTSKPVTSRGPSRGRARAQTFRVRKGEETLDALHKSLNERLFVGSGFATAANFLNNLDLSTTEEAVRISISTRGIGFMIAVLWNRLKNQFGDRFTRLGDVNSILRATLSQLAYQLQVVAQAQQKSTMENNIRAEPMGFEMTEAIKMNPVNFTPLADMINSLGNFRHADCQFYPTTAEFPVLDPARITIQNLRANALAMSRVDTPAERRRFFFERNAIPGAVWRDDPAVGPLLVNADEIVPNVYTPALCRRDFAALKNCLDFASRKYPRLRGECSFTSEGSPGQLVSCELAVAQTMSVQGEVIEPILSAEGFWQLRNLPPAHYAVGVLCLNGEITGANEFERTRHFGGATRSGFVSWSNIASGLISSLM